MSINKNHVEFLTGIFGKTIKSDSLSQKEKENGDDISQDLQISSMHWKWCEYSMEHS